MQAKLSSTDRETEDAANIGLWRATCRTVCDSGRWFVDTYRRPPLGEVAGLEQLARAASTARQRGTS